MLRPIQPGLDPQLVWCFTKDGVKLANEMEGRHGRAFRDLANRERQLGVTQDIPCQAQVSERVAREHCYRGSSSVESRAQARARSRSKSRSRAFRVSDAARSNSGPASSKRPSLARRSPRTLGKRW